MIKIITNVPNAMPPTIEVVRLDSLLINSYFQCLCSVSIGDTLTPYEFTSKSKSWIKGFLLSKGEKVSVVLRLGADDGVYQQSLDNDMPVVQLVHVSTELKANFVI